MSELAKTPSTNGEVIYTGATAADWLTLTTWSYRQWHATSEALFKNLAITQKKLAAKLQYQGSRVSCESGGMFAGIGQQRGGTHCIIEISGGAAQMALDMLVGLDGFDASEWRCTRIDLQRTLPVTGYEYTADAAAELHARVRESGLTAGFVSSKDARYGELATVYIGSQKSGRFMRVYQKVVGDQVMLRAEAVFRYAGGSDTMFSRVMSSCDYTIGSGYAGAIAATGDTFLIDKFSPADQAELPTAVKVQSKTVAWLLKVVMPVITRVVSQHDGYSHLIAIELMGILRQCCPPEWWEGDTRE